MMTQPDPAKKSGRLALSRLGLRRGIGFLSLVLPFVLMLGTTWLGSGGIRGSISGYCYTVMPDYFVATMCAMGVLLASLQSIVSMIRTNAWLPGRGSFTVSLPNWPRAASIWPTRRAARAYGLSSGPKLASRGCSARPRVGMNVVARGRTSIVLPR
jgi:hypothetical protein